MCTCVAAYVRVRAFVFVYFVCMHVFVYMCDFTGLRPCACVLYTLLMMDTMTYTLHPIQVKLLQSLGLRSTLITDGSQPVNLFTTAQGLLGAISSGPSNPEEED